MSIPPTLYLAFSRYDNQLAATVAVRYGSLALPVIPHGKYRVL